MVALTVFLLAALALADAEDVVAVFVALTLVLVLAVLAGLVAVVPPGLVLALAGLPLVSPAAGLPLVSLAGGLVAWVTLGVTDLVAPAGCDGEALVGAHVGGFGLCPPMAVLPWVRPVGEDAIGLPVPATLPPPPPLLLCGASADEPSWMKASRSGGTAMATPIANTAQAMARAGRSSQSRREWPRSAP